MEIDYRLLLKKYMAGVGYAEGVYFIGETPHEMPLSDEELAELEKIADEIGEENYQ